MRSSWVTTFAVSGVLFVLTLFLGLQYNWLRQANAAERDQMQRRAESDTKAFADDFNREIQAAYFNFQTDAAAWRKADWTEFNERYDYWRSKTEYPGLISDIVYFGNGGAQPLRYDREARTFVPAEISNAMGQLRTGIENGGPFQSFYEDQSVLVMPIHEPEEKLERIILRRSPDGPTPSMHMPVRAGLLFIQLDRSVLTDKVLPDLAAKHFPDGNFKVSVSGANDSAVYAPNGQIGEGDAMAGLVNLTPDNLMFIANRGMWSQFKGEKRQDVVINERVESKTFTHSVTVPDGKKTGTFTLELQKPAAGAPVVKNRTSVIATSSNGEDPWTLKVQHTAGSVAAFAKGELRKSFLLGLGVYLLLVGAIVAIVLSAMRSKRFAQRQIDFVSSVSHEFRTPLAVIYSAGENLADGVANDVGQVTRYGNLIKGEGRKLSAMVEQILQFAGARSGKKKYNFAEAGARDVVAAAINQCSPLLEEKGIELETAIDNDLPQIKADSEALSTALQNLISNSVKYSNGSKWLKVSAANGGGTIKFSVEDRGIGISDADLKHVFEPFYRARNVVDAQIHGNGLGLSLVKEIAEAHGGKVRAESETGKGSKFTIEIPQAKRA